MRYLKVLNQILQKHFILFVTVLVIGISYLSFLRIFNAFPIEDAFISFRYIKHLLNGYGLVFNPGEMPVEGYSNFLWILVVAVTQWLFHLDIIQTSLILSIVFMLSNACLIVFLYPYPSKSTNLRIAVLMGILLNPFLLYWTYSGMETALFSVLITLILFATLSARNSTRSIILLALVQYLLVLCRMDGLLIVAVSYTYLFFEKKNAIILKALPLLGLFLLPYFIWKIIYFGNILPNTFYSKALVYEFFLQNLLRGFEYVVSFLSFSGFIALLVPCLFFFLLGLHRKHSKQNSIIVIFFLTVSTYFTLIMVVGGDFYDGFRFLVPFLPVLIYVLITICHDVFIRLGFKLTSGILAIILLSLFFSPAEYVRNIKKSSYSYYLIAKISEKIFPPNFSIALAPIGVYGYYTDFKIIDTLGIVEPHIARTQVKKVRSIGHEKGDGEYILAQNPDVIFFRNTHFETYPFQYATIEQAYASDETISTAEAFLANYESFSVRISAEQLQGLNEFAGIYDGFKVDQPMYLGGYVLKGTRLLNVECQNNQSCVLFE